MKPVMPSTGGDLTIHLVRGKSTITVPKQFQRFQSIRSAVNSAITKFDDDPANPVEGVRIEFDITDAA